MTIINHLLRSTLRSQSVAASRRASQEYVILTPFPSRLYGTQASAQTEDSGYIGFKGHDIITPFTTRWQCTNENPLVIERSEGSYVYDTNGRKYLDSLAGLWCTSLGTTICINTNLCSLEARRWPRLQHRPTLNPPFPAIHPFSPSFLAPSQEIDASVISGQVTTDFPSEKS